MVKWPFQRLSDLQLGDKKVTLNHIVDDSFLLVVRRILRHTLDCYYVFVAFNFSTNFGLDTRCVFSPWQGGAIWWTKTQKSACKKKNGEGAKILSHILASYGLILLNSDEFGELQSQRADVLWSMVGALHWGKPPTSLGVYRTRLSPQRIF